MLKSLFTKSFGNKSDQELEQKSFLASDQAFSIFTDTPTVSGKIVTGNNALKIPAVLQAVRLISETVASLPCKVYEETKQGKEQAKDHSAFKLVHNRANEWTSAGRLREDLTKDALIHGGGFARVVRFEDGRPFELHRIQPDKVTLLVDTATGAPAYRVQAESGHIDYSFKDILHIPAFGGASPVKLAREAIGLSAILEEHGAKFFNSGAKPSGVITFENLLPNNEMGEKAVSRIFKAFQKSSSDGFKAPPVLDGGAKYQQIALSSTDAQFTENRVFQIDEIARAFGVPPTMLFELTRGTWSNSEEMARSFLQLCLRPWLDRWQDAFATVLLDEDEQNNFYFEFVVDDLQRADSASRADIFGKLVAARVMTPNEVRAAMNLPAMEGGDELANPYTTTSTVTNNLPKNPGMKEDI